MARKLAAALAINRALFGVAYLVEPKRTGAGWIGRPARKGGATVLTRALGARDLALALGALAALRGRGDARGWFAAHALADGGDLAATLAARDDLPRQGFRFATAMAGASTAVAIAGAIGAGPSQPSA
jgi:hypothetical protein